MSETEASLEDMVTRDDEPDTSGLSSELEDPTPMHVYMDKLGGIDVIKVSERTDWVKQLIYGLPGVGKTRLAGSAAEVEALSPVLFVDIEGGTKAIRAVYPDVDVIRVRDEYNEAGKLIKTAWQRLQDVYEDLRRKLPYQTVVVDSVTEAHRVSMASVMSKVAEDPSRDPDIPAQRDWGKSGEQIRRMVRAFRDLDCHVIFTALEQESRDPREGTITIRPSLPGKLGLEVPGYLDEIFYLYTKVERSGDDRAIKRYLLTQPTDKFVCKDRSDKLPTVIPEPSMAKIAELVLD